ncbi:MAG: beta-aspartyl-peptidase [Lachnospiraceae bacterium]|nr:beta-aspartyl-peptidase [Lachnospiraceae bacterium]
MNTALKLIRNVRILSPQAGPCDLLFAGGEIAAVGGDLSVYGALAESYDAEGRVAVPGYFDQHVHVTGGGGEGGFIYKVPEITLRSIVEGGVTSLVGLLGTDGITRSVENLVSKIGALREQGISAWCLTGSYDFPSPTLTGSVERDIAFIDPVIGVKIAISDHRGPQITADELIRLGAQARVAGLISGKAGIVHLHTGRMPGGLSVLFDAVSRCDLPITVFRPTHLGNCFEDAVRFGHMGGFIDFTAGDAKKAALQLAAAMEQVDVSRVTLSSDSNGSMPIWNEKKEMVGIGVGKISMLHDVVRVLVKDLGFSIPDAVRPITKNPARALGMKKKGELAEGFDADLVLYGDDLSIDAVFAKGRPMMWNGEVLVKGVFE